MVENGLMQRIADWWFVAEFDDGILHMNNDIGMMILIQKDGKELGCYI